MEAHPRRGSEKLVYDGGNSAQSIVPYLPLSELTPRRPPAITNHKPAAAGRFAMRSPVAGVASLILLFVVIIIGYSSVFTVSQTEQVLVVRLGEPVRVVTEPGLNFKAPFVDSVISIDKRILDLENPSQEVIASDQSGWWSTPSRVTGSRTRCGFIRVSGRSRPPTFS